MAATQQGLIDYAASLLESKPPHAEFSCHEVNNFESFYLKIQAPEVNKALQS